MKHFLFSIFFLTIILAVNAAKVETLNVYSNSMKKNTRTCVVTPDSYNKTGKSLPVLYLLHGHGGNYASWINDFPQLRQLSDMYNLILVGVDGGFSSWYFDSPIDSTFRYETYVTKEVIGFIDSNFNTVKSREGRAVTGLSMGGHGALYLSIRHQDIFGVSGSMSGGVDFRPFPKNWDIAKRLGDITLNPENWEKNTVIYQLSLIKSNNPAMIIDCGVNDFFINVNRQLHEKMLDLKINHDYIERPGVHNIDYWRNSLQYQVLFFDNYFKKNIMR